MKLLTIVEVLKVYRYVWLSQEVTVYTDHKNLTYPNTDFSSGHMLWQQLVIEEFGAKLVYVPGVKNTVTNTLSRLDTGADELNEKKKLFSKELL